MKLNFDFKLTDWSGNEITGAAEAMTGVLTAGTTTDERYLDKINLWGRMIAAGEDLEVDEIDAKEIKSMAMSSQLINPAKATLKNYVQDTIDGEKL